MEKKAISKESLAKNSLQDRTTLFQALTHTEIQEWIGALTSEWKFNLSEWCLERQMFFPSYMEEIHFVLKLAELAEEINHHPDLILGYKTMTIRLSTHNISAVSLADFVLAAKIDNLK